MNQMYMSIDNTLDLNIKKIKTNSRVCASKVYRDLYKKLS